MPQLIQPDEAVGKTIAGVWDVGGWMIGIRFTDGTYLAIRAELYGDEANIETNYPVQLSDFVSRRAAVSSGMFTGEEWDAHEAEEAASKAASERAEYERLAAKFGKG